jgi:MerR family transcriptional regulator, copper efflux regulator
MPAMTNGASAQPRLMTIGEVARRSGFTIRTLRFYERRGLLAPTARRASGYRLYGEMELHQLAFIRQAKTLGLTLAAIQPLVVATGAHGGAGTRDRLARVLGDRIRQTSDQLARLTDLRTELRRRRRALARRANGRRTRGYCSCLQKSARD